MIKRKDIFSTSHPPRPRAEPCVALSGGVPRGGPRPQPPGANAHGDSEQPPRVGLPPPVVGPGFENRSPTRAHAACPLPPGGQVRVITRRVLPQHPHLRTQYPPANASYAQLRAAWPIPS